MSTSKFKEQLIRQIGFLQNSCNAFDSDNWDEAIRIATSIRVILHDTPQSTSILTHLNAKDINLFTTYFLPPPPPEGENGLKCITLFSMGKIAMGPKGYNYGPDLRDFSPGKSHVLPVEEWWNQVVWMVSPQSNLTRKLIVLSAANQDGGAHVDSKLGKDYEKLAKMDCGTIHVKVGKKEYRKTVNKMHLVFIRTVGNELLKSPELLKLLE